MTWPQRKLKLSPHSSNDIHQVPEGNIKIKRNEKRKKREIAEILKYPTTWNINTISLND